MARITLFIFLEIDMPYQNVPEEMQDKMESCVMQVSEGGEYDKEAAIAICYTSVVEGKSLDAAKAAFLLGQVDAQKHGDHDQSTHAGGGGNVGKTVYKDEVYEKLDTSNAGGFRVAQANVNGFTYYVNKTQDGYLNVAPERSFFTRADELGVLSKFGDEKALQIRTLYEAAGEIALYNNILAKAEADAKAGATKIGARNSAGDAKRLQLIHDYAVENGAQCHEQPEVMETPFTMSADTLVYHGAEVKALGDGKIGGYLVRYGSPDDTDAEGDFFAPDTDFGGAAKSDVYYHHGMDATLKTRKLAEATLRRDDVGVWAETQLKMADEYERRIYDMAAQGKLGWSSGTAPHLVERKPEGKARKIIKWPLGLDASLTPTPAEYRNRAIALKSLLPVTQQAAETAGTAQKNQAESLKQEVKKMELTQEEIKALTLEAARTAIAEQAAAQPPIKSAGVAVVKDAADNDFASAAEFLTAVKSASVDKSGMDVRLKSRASEDGFEMRGVKSVKANGLNEAIPSQGGYLVQNGLAAGIIERMYNVGQILSRVARDQVGPNSNGMTYNAIDETSRADGSRFGGVQGYWLAEAGTKTASKPKFRQMDLKLKKVIVAAYATDELLQDATALESWMMRNVPEELRFKVEDAVVNGDGAGKPLGILSGPGVVSVAKESGQAAATVNYTNVVKMWARLWAGSRSNAVWLINQDVEPQLDQMALAVGTAGIPANFVTYGPDSVMRIKGRPVVAVEYCQTLGTVGDIILADLSQYQTIEKGGVQSASSIHVQFLTDETTFRWVYRVDGQPIWNAALTPKNGTNSVAPFVTLATRS